MNRKHVIAWIVGVLGAIVLIVGGGFLFLRTQTFQQYAIHKLVQATDEATGGRAKIQRFDFTPSTLTATLYGVTVRGTESRSDAPLLQVQKLTVGIKIQS